MSRQQLAPVNALSKSSAPTLPTLRSGDVYYDSTLKTLRVYDGAAWVDLVNDETTQDIAGFKTFTSGMETTGLNVWDNGDWYSYFDPQTLGIFSSSGTWSGAQFEVAPGATVAEVNLYPASATVGGQTRSSQLVLGTQRWTGAATDLETVTFKANRWTVSRSFRFPRTAF